VRANEFLVLPPEIRLKALKILKENIPLDQQTKLRAMVIADPVKWFVNIHFWGGMAIRNLLRKHGLTDDLLPVYNNMRNLDNHYVSLVEVLVQEGCYYDLPEEVKNETHFYGR
jgi:hypothetical protein